MKKFIAIVLSVISVFTVLAFSACGNNADVKIKYYKTAAELMPALKSGAVSFGLLAEPAATKLEKMTKADGKTWYRLDIQELYDAETENYPQAVMLVKESLLNTHKDLVNAISEKFADNVSWVSDNIADAVNAVNAALPKPDSGVEVSPSLDANTLTAAAVENCNISWQSAENAKNAVKKYLNDIINIDAISAKIATDDLFYDGTAAGEFTADTIKVFAPDGAPALAIAKFIADDENFGTGKTFEYNVVAANAIAEKVQNGTGDIVIIPVNAASKLYDKFTQDPYKLVSVITHGNVYLMCSEEITANDLKNKTVGVFNMGGVPDITFKVILNKLGLKVETAD